MKTIESLEEMRALRDTLHAEGKKNVLVPTMGALHEGHANLLRLGREQAGEDGCLIASVFVNPTQFDRPDDLESYPRTLEADKTICEAEGVDVLFAPTAEEMYSEGHSIAVSENSLSSLLCGASREGHFEGVCTVVLKLFMISGCDIAIFGKKDYQQLAIIKRMVGDLNLPVKIIGAETVREESRLARSSRNENLSAKDRKDAAIIYQSLLALYSSCLDGMRDCEVLCQSFREALESSCPQAKIDYIEIVDKNTLQKVAEADENSLAACAVFFGETRLIDNLELVL